MRFSKFGTPLVVAFAIGCATAQVASQLAVPPAWAGTNPQRWEYICGEANEAEKATSWANELGKQGWELAAAGGGVGRNGTGLVQIEVRSFVWCFKRPVGQ